MTKNMNTKASRKRRRKKWFAMALAERVTKSYREKLALLPFARLSEARTAYARRCNKINQRRNKQPKPAPFLIGGAAS